MQIEKQGDKDSIEYRIKCKQCGCIFRFKRLEVLKEKDTWRISTGYVCCPQCEYEIHFYGSDLRDAKISSFEKFIELIAKGFKTVIKAMFERGD